MFILFFHNLDYAQWTAHLQNLPEPGDLGCGRRPCRGLHWDWEAEGFPGPIYGWERRRGCKHHHFKLGLSPFCPSSRPCKRKAAMNWLTEQTSNHILKENSTEALPNMAGERQLWVHSVIHSIFTFTRPCTGAPKILKSFLHQECSWVEFRVYLKSIILNTTRGTDQ